MLVLGWIVTQTAAPTQVSTAPPDSTQLYPKSKPNALLEGTPQPTTAIGATPATATSPQPEPSPSVSPAQQAATPPSAANGLSSEKLQKFRALTEEVKKAIPTQADLQKMNEHDVHYTPEVIVKAGIAVGQVAEAISADPSLAAEGFKFYRECAETETNPNSVRATCFQNHEELMKTTSNRQANGQANGQTTNEQSLDNDTKVSDHIKKLAKKF
jgi:hypothetical protein